ncbi:hypothetical protein Q7C_2484 [Methylophaga frappieri]|uniref:Uncharacterized protein n=1 Tax=Methylophaga frappieri (strain ATCC BAA-2434 / DSM 25690 / JAM7) TaxID=754477 RepID=I1YL16_METFJ|nr:hypothetical protein [Methylophaga frappieri]AFJ03609.1 hypothetical protein Q7C_2484 [Methylophaga frappieri]
MIQSFKRLAALSLLWFAGMQSAFAHPGHDHSAWTSGLIHAIFYLSIVGVVSAIAYSVHKKIKAKKNQ